MSDRKIHLWAVVLLVVTAAVLALYKLVVLDYTLEAVVPRTQYDVELSMTFDGHNDDVRVSTFAPVSDLRQQIHDEVIASSLHLDSEQGGLNRQLRWSGAKVADGASIHYRFSVLSRPLHFDLAEGLAVSDTYPPAVAPYLRPEPAVQVDTPEVRLALQQIGADRGGVMDRLRRIHALASDLEPRPFKGTTDALTALRLGEASCNGKSHVFVALARATGIPARLVGGLVVSPGPKRVTHQWVEVYVAGHWVPFDSTNGHFAELPERYLKLYVGDEVMFTHTKNINFDYRYHVTTRLVPTEKSKQVLGAVNVWALFERLELPFSMLSVLLLLPVGALVVVMFRNVIGVPTYGTFLPALIAAAAAQTGLLWGLVGLAVVILFATLARWLVHRLELLHSPTLAILLAAVTVSLLGITMVSEKLDLIRLAHISLFPIAVLAITAERFFLSLVEHGPLDAVKHLTGTLVVILASYLVMNSLALQVLVSAFPEILLVVIALDIYLGRWVGMRLGEYIRFRHVAEAGGR